MEPLRGSCSYCLCAMLRYEPLRGSCSYCLCAMLRYRYGAPWWLLFVREDMEPLVALVCARISASFTTQKEEK